PAPGCAVRSILEDYASLPQLITNSIRRRKVPRVTGNIPLQDLELDPIRGWIRRSCRCCATACCRSRGGFEVLAFEPSLRILLQRPDHPPGCARPGRGPGRRQPPAPFVEPARHLVQLGQRQRRIQIVLERG